MRIACLQFSPQVGDTDHNLNRGDAVLNKARPEELEALDLIVLPEMAFSGYNFKSLHQIHPFLEPSGSGISSLWARTTALKFNTKVLVGYPEKVDVSAKWPASPEYYDSAIMVNGEGETIVNYRKNFLHRPDQTWALEGHGFFCETIPGLGKTCIGICKDLNPYQNESPWNAFEFAHYALEAEAEVVIVCMSWVTRQEHREFSRTLAEPDMETLNYWVQRLEPLIVAELEREVIVVFCNRCGQEDEALYAGTSAIIGIQGGEVNVYALAGRGTKEYLMADTSSAPFAKLIQGGGEDENAEPHVKSRANHMNVGPANVPAHQMPPPPPPPPPVTSATLGTDNLVHGNSIAPPRSVPPGGKRQRPSPKLQIPQIGSHSFSAMSAPAGGHMYGGVGESPIMIPTPEAPSPTPLAMRPKLVVPDTRPGIGDLRNPSPYPHDIFMAEQFRFFGSRHQPLTPVPPSDEIGRTPSRYYWKPSDTLLNTPFEFTWEPSPESPNDPNGLSLRGSNSLAPLTPYPGADLPDRTREMRRDAARRNVSEAKPDAVKRRDVSPRAFKAHSVNSGTPSTVDLTRKPADCFKSSQRAGHSQRTVSPKPRSESRSQNRSRNGVKSSKQSHDQTSERPEGSSMDAAAAKTDCRPPSSQSIRTNGVKNSDQTRQARSGSSTSRQPSQNRNVPRENSHDRAVTISNASNTPAASPHNLPSGSVKGRSGSSSGRPPSRTGQKLHSSGELTRPTSKTAKHLANGSEVRSRTGSVTRSSTDQKGGDNSETMQWRPGMQTQSTGSRFDEMRPVSRGRQRFPTKEGLEPTQAPKPHHSSSQPSPHIGGPAYPLEGSPRLGSSTQRRPSQTQVNGPPPVARHVSVTRVQSASRQPEVRIATPQEQAEGFMYVEEYHDTACAHNNNNTGRAASASAVSHGLVTGHKIPSIADGRAIVGQLENLPPPPPVSGADSDSDDGHAIAFKGPSVLSGRVRTTIVTAPLNTAAANRTEFGVSILTPPLSAMSITSAFSAFSAFSALTDATVDTATAPETPRFDPTTTPQQQQQQVDMALTPRGMTGTPKPMALTLDEGDLKRGETPFAPLTCDNCGQMERDQMAQLEALVAAGAGAEESRPRSW